MSGTPVPLGPWPGGLNNVSERGTIADDQVSFLENFEQDTDGTMVSRPPIIPEGEASPLTGDLTMLGYYITTAGTHLVVAAGGATHLYNVDTKTWQQIWDKAAADFVQYDNKAVLISTTTAGGYWQAGTWTDTPTMPRGARIVFYQERFWAYGAEGTADATTVWFSKVTAINPAQTIWEWEPNSDYFTVGLGDGEWITGMVADLNALLIFKNRSTWQFSYPSSPANGTLRQISSTIGAENRWSIVPYENYWMIYCAGYVYQFINYRHYPLNLRKVDFHRSSLTALQFDIRLSIFGRRLLLWFYGTTYVYNIAQGNWSTWKSSTNAAHFLAIPDSSLGGEARVALAVTGENDAGKKHLWRISEDLPSGTGEQFTCTVHTKSYTLDESAQHKRIFYWTADVATADGIRAIAHPTSFSRGVVTWDTLDQYTWDELDKGSWDNPVIQLPTYEDDIGFPAASAVRALVKVLGPFRFLSCWFEVQIDTDGTPATAPARIYTLTPYLKIKAGVSGKVS